MYGERVREGGEILTAVSEPRVIRIAAISNESRRCESARNQPRDELYYGMSINAV